MPTQARIFISYSRKDGSEFAKTLRTQLIEIFGEHAIWRDRDDMEGGVGWWNQIQEALEAVEFMVLVATPAAMQSEIVKKEWRTARQLGVCVYPVLVPGLPIDFDQLPRWMRDAHFYTFPDEWETFINYLKNPCQALRAPFMAEPPPSSFVERPELLNKLVSQLLDDKRQEPIAITTAFQGTGGFGKTTLAQAICANEDIQNAFDDGILWATLGEKPDVVLALQKVYKALTGKDGAFQDTEEGGRLLDEALTDKYCLIVIDDVWNINHLRPFLRAGERCARLITTRDVQITVYARVQSIQVDEMTPNEARALLGYGIDGLLTKKLDTLTRRLGDWALMLEIANGMMHTRQRATNGTWDNVYTYITQLLDRYGVKGIRADDENLRRQGVEGVLSASLGLLDSNEQARLSRLAIFKDDQNVPVSSIMALWGMGEFDTERLLTELARLSLIRYNSSTADIRRHNVVRQYLLSQLTDARAAHNQLITGYGDALNLPDPYAWRFYAYHLHAAERLSELRPLLLSYRWLEAKLARTEVSALLEDCDRWLRRGKDEPIRLIRSALEMSANILIEDKSALAHQLVGRLMHHRTTVDDIGGLYAGITPPTSSLFPIANGYDPLIPAGGMLRRTMKHEATVNGALELDDGRILSWSEDATLRLWAADGAPLDVLRQGYYSGYREIIATWAKKHDLTLDDLYPHEAQEDRLMVGGRVECRGTDIIIYHPQTGERITTFYADAQLTTRVAVTANGHVLAVGDKVGRVVFLRWVG